MLAGKGRDIHGTRTIFKLIVKHENNYRVNQSSGHISHWATFAFASRKLPVNTLISLHMKMQSTSNKICLFLVSQALENDPGLKIREAARVYAVPRMTLTDRTNGLQTQSSSNSNKRKLTKV